VLAAAMTTNTATYTPGDTGAQYIGRWQTSELFPSGAVT